jgi:ribosomal-protein-alanine N-acetyltransferase
VNWFKIRRARPQDKDSLHRIERACFALPWGADELVKDATDNILAIYYVAERSLQRVQEQPRSETESKPQPELVGYAGMWVVIDEGHITNVAVDPVCRRKGIAAMLLMKLLEAAREKGAKRFTLEVKRTNEAAITLYKRFGFRGVGYRKGYYREDGEDAIIMWLE